MRREMALDWCADIIGSFVLAVGLICFAEGASIAPGGVSGLALLARRLWGWPVGLTALAINLPLLAIAWRRLGWKFVRRTLRTLAISTFMLDGVAAAFLPRFTGDRLLGSICAGLCTGAGLGLIFIRGSTTAGTDIISRLIERRFPHIPLGTALLFVDGLVLALSIPVFGNMEAGLFGGAALYCQTRVIDGVLYGMGRGRAALIVSNKGETVAARVLNEMERGATLIQTRGAYSGQTRMAVLTVFRPSEFYRLKTIVQQEDPAAFMIITEAHEIIGEGFGDK